MKITPLTILLLALVLACNVVLANHIVGGELLYKHIADNTYRISLTLYGECSGSAFPHLKVGKPRIAILNEQGVFYTLVLTEDISQRAEVTNVCPQEANNTTCVKPQGAVPGITRFVYSATTELVPATHWRLLFAGELDSTGKSQTGLSTYISNIKNNTGLDPHLYLEATLNNMDGPNSTPAYTVVPTPRYCLHQRQQYNQGVVDSDFDELLFSLVPPLDLNAIVTEYIPPYTAAEPFASQPGSFSYSRINGQLVFIPVKAEVAFIVNKVEEYRNGKLVGSSMRGMTFFMTDGCGNTAPYGDIDPASAVEGIVLGNTVNLCKGADKAAFTIRASDVDGHNVSVTLSNVPGGAAAGIVNNNSPAPEINFYWDISNTEPGNYTFYAEYNDGFCPTPGKQVVAYTIRIVEPFTVAHQVVQPTNCLYKQKTLFNINGGIRPYKIRITDSDNNTIASHTLNTNNIIDSFRDGEYTLLAYADNLPCSTEYKFEVTDGGIYPHPPLFEDLHHCLQETEQLLNPVPAPGGTVQWYDLGGNRLNDVPVYNTDSVGHYGWLLNQRVKVCESAFDTLDIYVHEYPDIEIGNQGGHACVGDRIYLVAMGGVRYEWKPMDKIRFHDEKPYVRIYEPQIFTVTGYSEYNCSEEDTLVFDDIERCCLFSYPNAFSPNGDGINDGWHPVTYGNVDFYLLSVYDRWGQRIFISSDPKEKWDGNFRGKACDVGTYHYLLRAKCITGHEEMSGGSVMLIR
ncbi:MAG TPA: gliding motility-associated C-terminal domain-containing protein [Flavipsychrobacter sp.]